MVPTWFEHVTPETENDSLAGFYNAIKLVMETGFAVTAFLSLFLNLVLPEEIEDEAVEITANKADDEADRQEWERIRRPSQQRKSAELNVADGGKSVGGESLSEDVEKMAVGKSA